mgnify:CR=1 FL=1
MLFKTILVLFISFQTFALTPKTVFLGIVSKGSGAGMFGHAFIAFSSTDVINSEMEIAEFNLEINVTEPEVLKQMSIIDKISGLVNGDYNVYTPDMTKYLSKYLERNQKIYFYRVRASKSEVRGIYQRIITEKEFRDNNPVSDYDVFDKNCITDLIRIIQDELTITGELPSSFPTDYIEINHEIEYLYSANIIRNHFDLLTLEGAHKNHLHTLVNICDISLVGSIEESIESQIYSELQDENECKTHPLFRENYSILITNKIKNEAKSLRSLIRQDSSLLELF